MSRVQGYKRWRWNSWADIFVAYRGLDHKLQLRNGLRNLVLCIIFVCWRHTTQEVQALRIAFASETYI